MSYCKLKGCKVAVRQTLIMIYRQLRMKPGSFGLRHTVDIDFFHFYQIYKYYSIFLPFLGIKDVRIILVLDLPHPTLVNKPCVNGVFYTGSMF